MTFADMLPSGTRYWLAVTTASLNVGLRVARSASTRSVSTPSSSPPSCDHYRRGHQTQGSNTMSWREHCGGSIKDRGTPLYSVRYTFAKLFCLPFPSCWVYVIGQSTNKPLPLSNLDFKWFVDAGKDGSTLADARLEWGRNLYSKVTYTALYHHISVHTSLDCAIGIHAFAKWASLSIPRQWQSLGL